MSVWFSASAVTPQLSAQWNLTTGESSLLTVAVQLGFVAGALAVAGLGWADAVASRTLMVVGAIAAAVANLALLWCPGLALALPLRLATGAALALVYPSALKEASTWFRAGRGTALGVMIAALTLGSASPHLVQVYGGVVDWQLVIVVTSVMSAAGGLLVLLVGRDGPFPFPRSEFRLSTAWRVLRSRPVLLINIGYFGHMWELYAMWAWISAFALDLPALADRADRPVVASLIAFAAIGVGAVGCMVGGLLSDRWGRARAAALCMVISGLSAIAVAGTRTGPLWLTVALCLLWGFWIIADSAQFSALVTEHVDSHYVGTAVAIQLAGGFLLTNLTIWAVPVLAKATSWSVAVAILAIGPLIGVAAMFRFDTTVNGTFRLLTRGS